MTWPKAAVEIVDGVCLTIVALAIVGLFYKKGYPWDKNG